MDKGRVKAKEQRLVSFTDAFCIQYLHRESAELCKKLTKKIGREREVPFKRDRPEISTFRMEGNNLFEYQFSVHDSVVHIDTLSAHTTNGSSNRSRRKRYFLYY